MSQEWIVFGIVGFNLIWIVVRFYRAQISEPLSRWLLSRGRVKWAMRVRGHQCK